STLSRQDRPSLRSLQQRSGAGAAGGEVAASSSGGRAQATGEVFAAPVGNSLPASGLKGRKGEKDTTGASSGAGRAVLQPAEARPGQNDRQRVESGIVNGGSLGPHDDVQQSSETTTAQDNGHNQVEFQKQLEATMADANNLLNQALAGVSTGVAAASAPPGNWGPPQALPAPAEKETRFKSRKPVASAMPPGDWSNVQQPDSPPVAKMQGRVFAARRGELEAARSQGRGPPATTMSGPPGTWAKPDMGPAGAPSTPLLASQRGAAEGLLPGAQPWSQQPLAPPSGIWGN
ncbi:unnamed protein product, partial [Polarella glacialis]